MAGRRGGGIYASIVAEFNNKGIKEAQSEFKKFTQSVKNAQGFTGKLSAGVGALSSSLSGMIGGPQAAAGAIAAVGAASITAANEMARLSKAAVNLSAATGLSTEEASRWIAVGDDFEVSAETLTMGIGRLTKTLDADTWAKYGIATRDAAGQAKSTNAILLEAFDVLSGIRNETERARVGNELFGKGYKELAPLIGRTRSEYEKMLGSVEDGQVFTAEEISKAEAWRLAQDSLGDSINELNTRLAEMVVELAPVVELTADLVTAYSKVPNPIADFVEGINQIKIALGLAQRPLGDGAEAMGGILRTTEKTTGMYLEYQRARENATDAEEEGIEPANKLVDAYRRQAQYLKDVIDRENELYGFQRDLIRARQEFTAAQVEFNTVMGDAEASTQDQIDAAIKLSEEYATLEGASLDSKDGTLRQIESLDNLRKGIQPGSPLWIALGEYIRQLKLIPQRVTTQLGIAGFTGSGGGDLIAGVRADGGPVSSGRTYLVGEDGPELFTPSLSGMIIPNDHLSAAAMADVSSAAISGVGAGSGGDVYLNVTVTNPVASGEQLANELAAYTRRNGSRWLAGVV